MCHISILLLRTFSWPTLSNFDGMFINVTMNGDIWASFIVGFLIKLFFTKPLENLWKCFETLLVDGDVAGYNEHSLVAKFNQQASTPSKQIDYLAVFKQATPMESFYENLLAESAVKPDACSSGGMHPTSDHFESPPFSSKGKSPVHSGIGGHEQSTEVTKVPSAGSDEQLADGAKSKFKIPDNRMKLQRDSVGRSVDGSIITTTSKQSENLPL